MLFLAAEQDQDTGQQCQNRQHWSQARDGGHKCGKAHKNKVHSQQGHANISVHRISSLLVDVQKERSLLTVLNVKTMVSLLTIFDRKGAVKYA
jgi:hypothetical protein